MIYYSFYESPIGQIRLECTQEYLTGCWFTGQKYEPKVNGEENNDINVIIHAKEWLNAYFSGMVIENFQMVKPSGSKFREIVWDILQTIPYGKTMTYKEISEIAAKRVGKPIIAAQAVGGAVGHNPISIFIPCHRVVGTNGNLTGYAGGMDRKVFLLETEKITVIQTNHADKTIFSIK